MNGYRRNPLRSPRGLAKASMLAVVLCLLAIPALAKGAGGDDMDADERPVVQVELGPWRADVPPGVTLIVEGAAGVINNSFPALSADRSQIALLYYAGDAMEEGYPTFELYSTTSLAMRERVDLFPEHQHPIDTGQNPDLRDDRLLMRIKSLLNDINGRLRRGGFSSMETLFQLEHYRMDGIERFGKRIDYPSNDSSPAILTITSLSTRRIELEMEMPGGVDPYGADDGCGWGGNPQQAWYDPELQIVVLRMTFSTSVHGCEKPERWFLKRLQ